MSEKNASVWLFGQNKFESYENDLVSKKNIGNAKTISITSGKGGVGKTSITLKIAKMLAKKGYKTLVIDCDYNLSNTSVKLGIPVNNNFLSLLSSTKSFDECLYKDGHFHLLTACNGNVDLFDSTARIDSFIIDILLSHEREFDYILLDSPAGISRENLTLNAYCDERYVVVTPDKSSITDSYSLIKILKTKYGINENHLLINKASSETQCKKIINSIVGTVDSFLQGRIKYLGSIEKQNLSEDSFDKALFMEEKSTIHNNFIKVVERITEEDIGTNLSMQIMHKGKEPITNQGQEVL